jgi:hypothetical protein
MAPVKIGKEQRMRANTIRGALAGACLLWSAGAAQAAGMPWAKSLTAAMATAKKTNKLVMADFYTDW